MDFVLAGAGPFTQLDILRGKGLLFTVNVTGNVIVSAGPRMRVGIQTSADSFRVNLTLTLTNVKCSDEGIYIVGASGGETEERQSVRLTVYGE